MNRSTILGIIFIGPILFATAASRVDPNVSQWKIDRAQQTSVAAVSAKPVSIPFELVNRHIVLKVRVNNSRPLFFVLDTGDQYGIINLDVARELNLTLHGQARVGGAGAGTSLGSFVKDARFTVNGLENFSQPIRLALPIGTMAARMGQDFDGIIGSEFIKEFVVELDYKNSVVKLHNKSDFSYSGNGESIPIRLDQAGHPIVEALVTPIGSPAIKGSFVLDIGASLALALYSPFVNERNLLGPNLKTIKALGGAGAGGETHGRLGRIAELKIGSFAIKNPITLFSEDKAGAFATSAIQGNIGAQVISRFRVFLDYDHLRIIFEPTPALELPFDRAFSGISLAAEGKDYRTFRVLTVLENSPATEAGLQKDDVITSIDGKPATEFALTKLNEMFERPNTYKLTVLRGGQTLRVTLTPKQLV